MFKRPSAYQPDCLMENEKKGAAIVATI